MVYASLVIGLVAGLMGCAAEVRPTAERPTAERPPAERGPVSQAAPAAPGPAIGVLPPNGSRVTAIVRQRSVWPPGSLAGTEPAVRPNRTWYSVTLDVLSAAPVLPDIDSPAKPGTVIEAYSSEPLSANLVGTTVTAVVTLTGTTQGTRWLISEIGQGR